MSEQVDPVIRARQMNCPSHPDSFIKGAANKTARCPHCGLSRSDYEDMQADPFAGLLNSLPTITTP